MTLLSLPPPRRFRVHKHEGALLQHLLHVLPHRPSHLAGVLPEALLQGKEAD